ncbi:hypothetical protein F443_15091 [Phytophthora nicotianae P1569]|uniref:Uncharacterized protein n=1 Tax=Phytophthora nicotianae P1569 TaxID=1317065 RepID=V9EJE2_PHYNI|nr:hypothetical protein F443_15091 [Phytophthora nicotianae P1569]
MSSSEGKVHKFDLKPRFGYAEPEQHIHFVSLETAGSYIKHYAFNINNKSRGRKEVVEPT